MIPKVFHVIWVGDPMPAHLAAYVDTWRQVHPDWSMILWDEERLDATLDRTLDLFRRAPELTSHVGQFRSDVARYELLWRFGGVYVDCDFEALRPIDPLLEQLAGGQMFAAWETDGVWVNNAILGAEWGMSVLDEVLDGLAASVAAHPTARPNVQTGPQYLTPIVRRHRQAVRLFPSAWFYPYLYNELDRQGEEFPDAYAIHHWDNARKRAAARAR